jgi:uncharacterized membrane protein
MDTGSQSNEPNSKKSSTGLDENIGGLLCYVGVFVTGILFLIIEKENQFIRFHALQSTFVWILFFAVNMVFSFIPFIGWLINFLLAPVGLILWLLLMYKAFQGERFKLPIIGDMVEQQMHKS